jgi:hypothetical protein
MRVTGEMYDGAWDKGRLHGHDKMTWTTGETYEGKWVKGRRHGQGTKTCSNGDVYTGAFHLDEEHGNGTLVVAGRGVYIGKWDHRSIDKDRGTYTSADGTVWRGTWRHLRTLLDRSKEMNSRLPSVYDAVLHGECTADHPDTTRSRFSVVCGRLDKFRTVTLLVADRVRSVQCLWSDDAYALLMASVPASVSEPASAIADTTVAISSAAAAVSISASTPILGSYEALCFVCSKIVNTNKKHRTVGCKRGTSPCHTHCLDADRCEAIKESNRCPLVHKSSPSSCNNPQPACKEMRNSKDMMRYL